MVKLYQRYAPRAAFGVVTSGLAIFDWSGKLCLTAALEGVNIWNLRQLNLVRSTHRARSLFASLRDLISFLGRSASRGRR